MSDHEKPGYRKNRRLAYPLLQSLTIDLMQAKNGPGRLDSDFRGNYIVNVKHKRSNHGTLNNYGFARLFGKMFRDFLSGLSPEDQKEVWEAIWPRPEQKIAEPQPESERSENETP